MGVLYEKWLIYDGMSHGIGISAFAYCPLSYHRLENEVERIGLDECQMNARLQAKSKFIDCRHTV